MGIQICSNEAPRLFLRGDNNEIAKIVWRSLKIFLGITVPIWAKLGTKHPWVMGIKVCSNEGPCPFLRGKNNEIAKIQWRTLKLFFLRTTGLISTKLDTNHSMVMGIHVYSNEGPYLFPRRDNNEIAKIHWQTLKSCSQPNFAQSILGWREFKYIQMKDPPFSKGKW